MRMRRSFEMLMLFVVAFAATGSEPPVVSEAAAVVSLVTPAAETPVSPEEQSPDGMAALSGDANALLQVVQPLPRSLVVPDDDELPAEPPSCMPRRREELRRGFVRMLAEIARAVAH